MQKILTIGLLTLAFLLLFSSFVNKVEAATPTQINSATDLVNALGGNSVASADMNKVTLKDDINFDKEEFEILTNLELDLNGYSITSQAESDFITVKSNFTVSDTASKGKIEADSIFNVSDNGVLNIQNGTYNSFFYGISATNGKIIIDNGEFNNAFYQVMHLEDSELTVNDGKFNALADDPMGAVVLYAMGKSNVSIKNGDFYAKNSNAIFIFGETVINIDNGTFKSEKNHAISVSDKTKLTINSGKFESKLYALLINSADATINGGEFKAEGALGLRSQNEYAGKAIINGGNFVGSLYDGIYVEESSSPSTNPRMKLEINGGTFTGYYDGLYLEYAEGIVLKGGTFKSTATTDEDNYGGVFAVFEEPLSILAEGYRYYDKNGATLKVANGNNEGYRTATTVTVGKIKYKITIKDTANGKISTDKAEAIEGEEVKILATSNEGYEVDTVKVFMKDSNKEVEVKDLTFKMLKGDAIVEVTFKQKNSTSTENETTPEQPTLPEEPKEETENDKKEEISSNNEKTEENKNDISNSQTENSTINNPKTGDYIFYSAIALIVSILGIAILSMINKKFKV